MSLSLGRIIGVEVKVHYTWIIIFMLVTWSLATGFVPNQFPGLSTSIYWIVGAISALVLFVSVLFHELSHSYVAQRRGLAVPSITLFLFGGVAEIAEEPEDPGTEFSMTVVGPLSSFVLAGFFAAAWFAAAQLDLGAVIVAPLNYAAMINALLGGFNLLPAFPLDGGRMLRAGLWKRRGDLLSATKSSSQISSFISYGMMGLGFIGLLFGGGFSGLWLIFIGWFLKNGSESSLRQTIISKALTDVAVEDLMTEEAVSISAAVSLSEAVQEYFYRHRHGGYPVVDGERLVGIITMEDIRDVPKEKRDATTVEDVMTPKEELVYARPDEPAVEALIKLSKHDVGRLPVMEGEKLVGILTRSDLMRAIRVRTELE